MLGLVVGVGGGDRLFSSRGNGVGQKDGETCAVGWYVLGTNGLRDNVWVCGVRGDSRHCGETSAQQRL